MTISPNYICRNNDYLRRQRISFYDEVCRNTAKDISLYDIARRIFEGVQIAIVSIPPAIPALTLVQGMVYFNKYANQRIENWQRKISNHPPSGSFQQAVHRVESIAVFILKKYITFSTKSLMPSAIRLASAFFTPSIRYIGVSQARVILSSHVLTRQGSDYIENISTKSSPLAFSICKGIDYIEDISIKSSQKALEILGIPVQLNINLRQLKVILKEWENHAGPGENRINASKQIIHFYKDLMIGRHEPLSGFNQLALSGYQLRDLPNIFNRKPFSTMKSLHLTSNQLTTLPENIKALQYLRLLDLSSNRLSIFPDVVHTLPRNCEVNVGSNRFSAEEVRRTVEISNQNNHNNREGPRIDYLSIYEAPRTSDFGDTSNFCIDTFYAMLYRSIDRKQRDLSNLKKNETLRSWLHRLVDLPSYKTNYRMINENIINFLEEANQNKTFQAIFTGIIQDASGTCGDRVALSILHLDIAYQLEKIDLIDMKNLATFLVRGCWAIDLLEECARQKVASMRTCDEIEVYLGYPIALKQELNLPISQDSMRFFTCSGLTSDDLEAAKNYVESNLNNKDLALNRLIQYDKWMKALIYHKGSEMDAIEREKEQASNTEFPDYEAIQNRYNQAIKDLSRQTLKW